MRHLWSVACNCSTRQKPSRTTPTTTGGLRRHDPQELFSRIRSHVYSLEGRPCSDPIHNVECEDATPKTQNCLNSHSTPSWAMAPERCALSGCSHGRTFGEQQAEEYRCPRAFVEVTRLRRRGQPVEKLPLCTLSPQIGHQIRRFWGVSSPIRGRNQLNADFFNRLFLSTHSGE